MVIATLGVLSSAACGPTSEWMRDDASRPDAVVGSREAAAGEDASASRDVVAADSPGTAGDAGLPPEVVVFDFAGGDPMEDRGGVAWSGTRRTSRGSGGELGLEFAFAATPPTGDSTAEQRYSFAPGREVYQSIRLQIPSNFSHRTSMGLVVASAAELTGWVAGDTIVGVDGASRGQLSLIEPSGAGARVWLRNADNSASNAHWVGTVRNERLARSATAVERLGDTSNNKLWAVWMDDYSSHGFGPTVLWEFWSNGRDGSDLAVHWSSGMMTGGGPHMMVLPFIDPARDRGRAIDLVVHVVASSARGAGDGVVELWVRRDGESGFAQFHRITNAEIAPPTEAAATARAWQRGYLMGWSNSGYDAETIFRISRFEHWGARRPSALPAR